MLGTRRILTVSKRLVSERIKLYQEGTNVSNVLEDVILIQCDPGFHILSTSSSYQS